MKIISSILFFSIYMSGCVSATATIDNACSNKDVNFPGAPLGINVITTVNQSVEQDLSSTLSKLNDIGDLSLGINSLTLTAKTGDFDFIKHIKVTVSNNQTQLILSDEDVTIHEPGLKVLNVSINNAPSLLDMLSAGPINLDTAITGSIPDSNTDAVSTLCVNVSSSVHKGL